AVGGVLNRSARISSLMLEQGEHLLTHSCGMKLQSQDRAVLVFNGLNYAIWRPRGDSKRGADFRHSLNVPSVNLETAILQQSAKIGRFLEENAMGIRASFLTMRQRSGNLRLHVGIDGASHGRVD